MNNDYLRSVLSHFLHYALFSFRRPPLEFDTASLIMSIDVDVGSPKVGVKNGGLNDRNVNDFLSESAVGRIEEMVIPLLIQTFNDLQFPVTFALRGQLAEVESSIFSRILESGTLHEIAAHGYYHRSFTSLSESDAEEELRLISAGMMKFGVRPKSFVFPRNKVSYLSLLKRYGYLSFRAPGTLLGDGMYLRNYEDVVDVHPSFFSDFCSPFFSRKIIDLAVKYKAPLHIWFHPWNLGKSPEVAGRRINKGLIPLINYAIKKKEEGLLKFETMLSIAEQYMRSEKNLSGTPTA
jgi:peptidoglycan/xylan/chitin deacetylase (PgdA/CDA1 family)